MAPTLLTERHSEEIAGVLSCFDRILIQGTLPGLSYAQGMTSYLYAHNIRVFDYVRFAQPLRESICQNAERLAAENGLTIEFLRRPRACARRTRCTRFCASAGTILAWSASFR